MNKSNHSSSIPSEEEEIMRELCMSNGLTYSRLKQEGLSCLALEMFFTGYHKFVGLHYFPNLQKLCLVGQSISNIDGLRQLTKLKELWIVECDLKSMRGLEDTKDLRRLYLYSNSISKIEQLDHMAELQTLHLNNNQITTIEGLSSLRQLKELNLAENLIKHIGTSLNGLQQLASLELAGNHISSLADLTNLSRLSCLRSLSLKSPLYPPSPVALLCNYTLHVIYHIPQLTQLDGVSVASKQVKDITEATVAKKKMFYGMRSKSVQYGEVRFERKLKKVRDEINTTTLERLGALHCLLKQLSREMEENARGELAPPSSYPFPRSGSGRARDSDSDTESNESPIQTSQPSSSNSNNNNNLSQVVGDKDSMSHADQLRVKQAAVVERIKQLENKLSIRTNHTRIVADLSEFTSKITGILLPDTLVDQYYGETLFRAQKLTSTLLRHLELELETGGNLRFEHGKPSDPWYPVVIDLVLSRFCVQDYKELNITGVRVHDVVRVNNRLLRTRFEDVLQTYIDEDDDGYLPNANLHICLKSLMPLLHDGVDYALIQINPSLQNLLMQVYHIQYVTGSVGCKKLVEYLFWVWDPTAQPGGLVIQPGGLAQLGGIVAPTRILEDGFTPYSTGQAQKHGGVVDAVTLSNSVFLSDRHRIEFIVKSLSKDKTCTSTDLCPYRYGQLILTKTYVGKSVVCSKPVKIDKLQFSEVDSVVRLAKDLSIRRGAALGGGAGSYSGGAEEGKSDYCECSSRQCEWYIFDEELVLPEYIINFEYVTTAKCPSPFYGLLESRSIHSGHAPSSSSSNESWAVQSDDQSNDGDVINMLPIIKPRIRLVTLSDDQLLRCSQGASSLSHVTCLDLHGNGLSRLNKINNLKSLRRLVVSFNELQRLDDLQNMSLEYLDVSFNKLVTLQGIKSLLELTYLDVSWNQLENTREDISYLTKHTPALTSLDLRQNPWQKSDGLRLRAIGRLKCLAVLNGQPVTDEESNTALRLAAGSRISQVSLISHSRMDIEAPRSLTLIWTAQALELHGRYKLDRVMTQDDTWYSKVTSLCLDGQHISKLSSLEKLENLHWASFADNDITKIEGLDNCVRLEELNLRQNCLKRLDGLARLQGLKRLCVECNYISEIDGSVLERLTQLQYLSIECNRVSVLTGLYKLVNLAELYVGWNNIDDIRQVFHLKGLSSLMILDLTGNSVVSTVDNYRLFVIYHLKSLRALDSTAIDQSDTLQAVDVFGGRMTQDFVADRLGHSRFNEVMELDFPQCSIQHVDLGDGKPFENLRSVNLEHNNLTSFSGLICLVNLKVLCLNHNRVESIVARPKMSAAAVSKIKLKTTTISTSVLSTSTAAGGGSLNSPQAGVGTGFGVSGAGGVDPQSTTSVLDKLEVLHLGYNGIKDMAALQLSRLRSLRALFLQGNEISVIDGLYNLTQLTELVLDRNKIKTIGDSSFLHQATSLHELHIEENRLRSLDNITTLPNLQRLFAGLNRIQNMSDVERLEPLSKLVEISLVNNPVTKRLLHRPTIVYRMPSVRTIDGLNVTEEERMKAQLYFIEQQPAVSLLAALDTALPGIGQYKNHVVPVKVTNVQLLSPHIVDRYWPAMALCSTDDQSQDALRNGGVGGGGVGGGGRKKGGGRGGGGGVIPGGGGGGRTQVSSTTIQSVSNGRIQSQQLASLQATPTGQSQLSSLQAPPNNQSQQSSSSPQLNNENISDDVSRLTRNVRR